jgi:hypothetical protein
VALAFGLWFLVPITDSELLCSVTIFFRIEITPKQLQPPAQRCRSAATLGLTRKPARCQFCSFARSNTISAGMERGHLARTERTRELI